MMYRVEVQEKPGVFDAVGQGVKKDISDLGAYAVSGVRFVQVYLIEGGISEKDVRRISEDLLIDPVTQSYRIVNSPVSENKKRSKELVIEIAYNPGVMDPVEESTLKGIADLGLSGVTAVKTAKKYLIHGRISEAQLHTIAGKLLYNKLIQHIVRPLGRQAVRPTAEALGYDFKLITIDLLGTSDEGLLDISKKGQLFLNIHEMLRIKKYFKALGRNPTDCELETIAQTWSEHCYHKTFRGKINYTEAAKSSSRKVTRKIDNLLKSTIMKATKELGKPWCVSVFKDNAGIIRFDDKHNVCFKVETHNHPSALEPFGGANTGVGGVIRDCLGTGLGAKPILNTDVFCFGDPDLPFSQLPKGTLHPKRVMKGVVSGVRDYGNKMGIPTVNGSIHFHERFTGNPLVYCGTVGIMPKDKSFKQANTGDYIVVAGGRTGRDGIHGATFSSGELTHESETVSSGAVQIGNPIQEKKTMDVLLEARDRNLFSSITDCGAGGLSSAVGEMAAELGAEVYLEKVPLKYQGLTYTEMWISESQERMVMAVPKEKAQELLEAFKAENVEATIIGEFTGTKRLKLYYKGNNVCDIDMEFLHEGIPQLERKAEFSVLRHKEPKARCPKDLTGTLHKLLSHLDICSKEWVIRQYDHEVQGGSVLKPLTGILNDGPSDASICQPVLGSKKGVIVSNGINFRYSLIDPFWMAASVIDEALRQIIAVGGSLKEAAILDNFCWGNPDKPDRLGSLVRASYGCYMASKGFEVPFISGKDSLNNEFAVHGRSVSIPGTLLISAIAVMDDISKAITMYAKKPGNLVYIVGETFDEMGASHYFDLSGAIGNNVPKVNPAKARKIFDNLGRATAKGLISAMHDCSEGGLGVAAAEMAFSGGLGIELFLSEVPYKKPQADRNDFVLFSESNSRFIVEVEKKNQKKFEAQLKGLPFGLIGRVSERKTFRVYGLDNKICVNAEIGSLKKSWQQTLKW